MHIYLILTRTVEILHKMKPNIFFFARISFALLSHWASLTKHRVKNEIIKNLKTKPNIFISLLDMFTFYQHSTFSLLMSKEKVKRTVGCPIFPFSFCVIIFRISGWLMQQSTKSKKGYNRAPWLFVFLRIPMPS